MTKPPSLTTAAASAPPTHRDADIDQRRGLAAMATSMAASSAPTLVPQTRPRRNLPGARAGLPLYYASAFVRDGFAHGVLVGTWQGRPIEVEGNAMHPSSLGATDIYAQASVLQLWDPDRSRGVRRRLATTDLARDASRIASSSWSEFETEWHTRAIARAQAREGATLRVLTGPLTSPTERALLAALLAREPNARWHSYAPLKDMAADDGARMAFGRALTPVFHFDKARCVLALAADPFSDGPGAVRHAMDWSAARDAASPGRGAALFAAEATPGLFGAHAGLRVALSPARIEVLLWRLAAHWMPEIPPADVEPVDAQADAFEAQVVAALRAAGDAALVIGGAGLSAEAQALVLALNQRLGAIGQTLTLIDPPDATQGAGTLADLVDALRDDSVDTLLVVGANPAYDAPSSFDITLALGRARLLVHAGLYVDETAVLADWHLPLSHAYEQWGDALAHDGSATLLQPAIAPLHDTRSAAELLALLGDDELRDGHDLVQRQWRAGHAGDFDAFWRASLDTGVMAASAGAAVAVKPARRPARLALQQSPDAQALVALFVPDGAAQDGAFANNAWLQALPRPFTGLTWDNAVLVSPTTAARLGIASGEIVRVQVDVRAVEAPVWVLAQHADDIATLPLGCGRRHAGRVGSGLGFDACVLRPTTALSAPVTLHRTGRSHAFAIGGPPPWLHSPIIGAPPT
jgi:molybdopterin-containing oxidoreductase family iron-sulfur binding subunit